MEREVYSYMGGPYKARTYEKRTFTTNLTDPADTTLVAEGEARRTGSKGELVCKSGMKIQSDVDYFHVEVTRSLYRSETLLRTKTFKDKIPRGFV